MNITRLKKNQVFVFGSNLAGQHLGGSARQALEKFGAVMGKGDGWQGQSYAFPTLDKDFKQRTDKELKKSVEELYRCCDLNRYYEFLLTKVGCGIAGYEESYIKSLFKNPPSNLILPEDWR